MPGTSTRWGIYLFCYGLLAFVLLAALGRRIQWPLVLSGSSLVDEANVRSINFQLDPNVANWSELACLPEIGPTLARRIVEFRTQRCASDHEPFRCVFHAPEDLLAVPGIGPKKLAGIRPYLKFPNLSATLTDWGMSR